MKLHEVPNGSMIRVLDDLVGPPGAPSIKKGEILYFGNIDGMHSYCERSDGEVVRVLAWADVEIVTDGENEER